jgi:hypothetical protein
LTDDTYAEGRAFGLLFDDKSGMTMNGARFEVTLDRAQLSFVTTNVDETPTGEPRVDGRKVGTIDDINTAIDALRNELEPRLDPVQG